MYAQTKLTILACMGTYLGFQLHLFLYGSSYNYYLVHGRLPGSGHLSGRLQYDIIGTSLSEPHINGTALHKCFV